MKKKYETTPELRNAIIEMRSKDNLTNKQLSKIFGESETFISKYVNDKLDHNPNNFELKAWEVIEAYSNRRKFSSELFDTSVTQEIHGRINFIRETKDIGILSGPAGIGKSSSAKLYCERNPSSIYVELDARTRNGKKLESAIFNSIENRSWGGNTARLDFLVDRLAGSQRVILIDNGQRLDADGRTWLFDFHDKTECPIIIIANPEVLDKIKGNDQHSSRIGICKNHAINPDTIAEEALRVAAQFSDQATAEEIADLVTIIAKRDGHFRSVRKEIILMQKLRELQPNFNDDPRRALRAAHRELVRDYDLPE